MFPKEEKKNWLADILKYRIFKMTKYRYRYQSFVGLVLVYCASILYILYVSKYIMILIIMQKNNPFILLAT